DKSNLHTTLYALYHEAIAQPLQPQATLFKVLIEVGSNYAYSLEIYLVNLHWGTLYLLPEDKSSYLAWRIKIELGLGLG
ncbi:MAG: hypothetical protein ACRDCF_01360, partial [Mycoplasmoidaceae bacterium]